jgi:hypothetical protein
MESWENKKPQKIDSFSVLCRQQYVDIIDLLLANASKALIPWHELESYGISRSLFKGFVDYVRDRYFVHISEASNYSQMPKIFTSQPENDEYVSVNLSSGIIQVLSALRTDIIRSLNPTYLVKKKDGTFAFMGLTLVMSTEADYYHVLDILYSYNGVDPIITYDFIDKELTHRLGESKNTEKKKRDRIKNLMSKTQGFLRYATIDGKPFHEILEHKKVGLIKPVRGKGYIFFNQMG